MCLKFDDCVYCTIDIIFKIKDKWSM